MPLLKNVSDCWFDGIIDNNKICYRENRDTKTRRRIEYYGVARPLHTVK